MSGRLARAAPALVFVAVLALYLATAAPGLTWAHGSAAEGGLVAAACTLGLAPPPGHPTYVLLGRLFTLLPFGAVAWRLNLLSALSGAGAAALTFAAARRLLAARSFAAPAALLASLLVAAGGGLWPQSLVAGPHGLGALAAALALYLALRLAEEASWRTMALLGLVLGLGLGNEQSLALLVPSLAILAWPALRCLPAASWLYFVDGMLAGLTVYLYIPLRLWQWPLAAWQAPPIAWGDPAHPTAWLRLCLAGGVAPALPLSSIDLAARLGAWLGLVGAHLSWPGALLAGLGLARWWARDGRLFAAAATGAALYGFYALAYGATEPAPHLLPALLLAALCLAEGARAALASLSWRLPCPALGGAAVLLVVVALAAGLPDAGQAASPDAERYAQTALAHLPDDAVVLSASDEHTAALWYAQWVLAQPRPHWALVDTRLLAHPWYRQALREAHADLALPDAGTLEPTRALVLANSAWRPVYLADPPPAPGPVLVPAGLH